MIGTLLTGVFVSGSLGGAGLAEGVSMGDQVLTQLIGIVAAILWCGILTWLILKLVNATVGLRVADEQETEGLDLAQHGERGYS
jgi:Amt family ammonium transporter